MLLSSQCIAESGSGCLDVRRRLVAGKGSVDKLYGGLKATQYVVQLRGSSRRRPLSRQLGTAPVIGFYALARPLPAGDRQG